MAAHLLSSEGIYLLYNLCSLSVKVSLEAFEGFDSGDFTVDFP